MWVVFLAKEGTQAAGHNAAAFGCPSSVSAWDWLGGFLTVVLRRMLGIPMLRYVDDSFAVLPAPLARRPLPQLTAARALLPPFSALVRLLRRSASTVTR